MSPEEKELLVRSLKLSEENNRLLVKLEHTARLQTIWGLVKVLIIVVPLIAGYFLLQAKASDIDIGALINSF